MIARVIAFVLPLGFDTLGIAVALGLRGMEPWRPALVFTMFETVMPIFGIIVGRVVGDRFSEPAEIAGGLILIGIGFHAFREALGKEGDPQQVSFASLRAAVVSGVGISMDELAVGFPLGVARLQIGTVLVTIAVQTFLVTAGGILIGSRIGAALGRRASRYARVIAGAAFCAVGIWLILEASMRRA